MSAGVCVVCLNVTDRAVVPTALRPPESGARYLPAEMFTFRYDMNTYVVRAGVPATGSPTVEVRARGMAAQHRLDARRTRLRADFDADGNLALEPAPEGYTF